MFSNKGRNDTPKLGSSVLQDLKIKQRRILIDSLEIGIPAPEQMIALGERQLSNGVKVGKLTNSKTLNYKRFTPHRDGLFCERIFGPVQSFVCACGKRKESVQNKNRQREIAKANLLPSPGGIDTFSVRSGNTFHSSKNFDLETDQREALSFCPKCQVEYISKNVRRHRLGYIQLFAPVTHIWYLKGRPSYLSLFLGKRKKAIAALAYCNAYLVEQICFERDTDHLLKETDTDVSALLKKSTAQTWENCDSNQPRTKNENVFVSNFNTSSFSTTDGLDLKPPASRQHKKAHDLDLEVLMSVSDRPVLNAQRVVQKKLSLCMPSVNTSTEFFFLKKKSCMKKKLRYKMNTNLDSVHSFLEPILCKNKLSISLREQSRSRSCSLQKQSLYRRKRGASTKFVTESLSPRAQNKEKELHSLYMRAQALPFLPSLICPFHLRDCLISLLQSFPCREDIPIPMYCQTPRRYPLRDVNTFLAEVRSTKTQNQLEKVSIESITRFLGKKFRFDRSRKSVSVLSKQAFDHKSFFSCQSKVRVQRSDTNVLSPTLSLQAIPKYLPNPKSTYFTPTSLLQKENRSIVVHKARHANSYSQRKVNQFQLDGKPVLYSESQNNGVDHVYKKKNSKASAKGIQNNQKRSFLGLGTKVRDFVFTQNGLDMGLINRSFYNQKVAHLFTGYISDQNSQSAFGSLCVQNKQQDDSLVSQFQNSSLCKNQMYTKSFSLYVNVNAQTLFRQRRRNNLTSRATTYFVSNVRIPKQESFGKRVSKPKLALLPLDLSIVFSSNSIRDSSFISFPSNTNPILGIAKSSFLRGIISDGRCFQNKLSSPEWTSTDISRRGQLLARESKVSLRGALLNRFVKMINAGLLASQRLASQRVDSAFSSLIPSTQERHFRYQDEHKMKRDTEFAKEKNVTSRLLSEENPKLILRFIGDKGLPQLDTKRFHKVRETKNRLFLHLSSIEREMRNKRRFQRFKYYCIPIVLYAQKLRLLLFSEKSNEKRRFAFRNSLSYSKTLKNQHSHAIVSSSGFNQINDKTPPAFPVNTGLLNQYKNLFYRHWFSQQRKPNLFFEKKNWLPSETKTYLQTLLFREKLAFQRIDTYQSRLLNLVFGVIPRNSGVSQLTDTKDSLLQNLFVITPKNGESRYKISSWKVSQKQKHIPGFCQSSGFPATRFLSNPGFEKPRTKYTCSSNKNNLTSQRDTRRSLFGTPKVAYTYLVNKQEKEQKSNLLVGKPVCNNVVDTKSQLLGSQSWYGFFQSQRQERQEEKLVLPLYKEPNFLQKLGHRSVLHTHDKERSAKWNSNGVKAFAKLDPARLDETQKDRIVEPLFLEKDVTNKVSSARRSTKQDLAQTEFVHSATLLRDTKQNTSLPTSFGSETISKWHINGAKEILLYTGGGALHSLLKRFNTSLFSQFLLGELQILRRYYKDQTLIESKRSKKVSEHSFDSLIDIELDKKGVNLLEQKMRSRFLHTDKNTNLFCRRIYRITRRLKIVQLLMRNVRRPEWMMISVLPVLPPDLRPVLQMGDKLIVASDLNTLYQRVIYRNNRHYKGRFLDFHFVSSIQRLVQDAVDRLLENGKGGSTPFLTPGGRPLKSLSDILKGKRGRFRFNLLGKRVDFSGRSVIVVDPNLKIHECGVPKEIALELYKYILIRQLLLQKRVSSIVNAKRFIKERRPLIWDTLRQILYYHPLLLNRAPTLHRLGIQAFQPKLIIGSAILLHPLVCAGFNADFDGDQMGVHLPLSPQARAEAWDLLWSRNNVLSPATGQPILLPSQDMVLGFYYMTSLLPYGTTKVVQATGKNEIFASPLFKEQGMISTPSQKSDLLYKRLTVFFEKKTAEQEQGVTRLSTRTSPLTFKLTLDISALDQGSVLVNTKSTRKRDGVVVHLFSDTSQLLYAYQKKQIEIHTPIWLKWFGKSENGEKSETPLEVRVNGFGDQIQIYPTYQFQNTVSQPSFLSFHIRTTVGRVLVNNLIPSARV